jgi:hypothetical protein
VERLIALSLQIPDKNEPNLACTSDNLDYRSRSTFYCTDIFLSTKDIYKDFERGSFVRYSVEKEGVEARMLWQILVLEQ